MTDKKEYMKQYREKNREKLNEYLKQWRENNPESSKEWAKENPKRRSEINIKSYIEHQKERLEQKKNYRKTKIAKEVYKKWYEGNEKERLQYSKQYHIDHPERIKEIDKRAKYKRKRNLGFNPLNKYFESSEAHHINKEDVIYIPNLIHKSISHCLETGRNMKKINRIAMDFILKEVVNG